MKILGWILTSAVCALLLSSETVQAVPFTYELEFQTNGQSIWDSGQSTTLSQSTFLGAAWEDKTTEIDLIAGNEDTNVPNPARILYDIKFAACDLLHSASTCINGRSARSLVVPLGSRPSVRSCGRYNFVCKGLRATDIARRATYDAAFSLCRKKNSSSTCRKGQSPRIGVTALGTAPAQFAQVDTRTGVAVKGTTDGRVGVELGVEIDSGSVDATVSYKASLDIPDTKGLSKANAINFNPNSVLAGTNTLNTKFANLELSVDAVMELSGNVTGEACVIGAGCKVGSSPFNIDETASIVSFNKGGEGEVLLLGQKPSVFGFPDEANGFPFAIDAGIAEVTLHLPQPDASGGLDPNSKTLKASGQDDLVDLIVDLDEVVASAAGLPGLFGSSAPIGTVGSIGFDIINVEIGPTVDLKQDFELDPTLFVELVFDKAVLIGGELVTSFVAAWEQLPDITFVDDVTTVTPTFFVEADLLNETLLDFDFEFIIDLLQIKFDLLGIERSFGIGNVLEQGVDLFESPNFYENLFPLLGFNVEIGESFVVDFLDGSTAPTTAAAKSAENPILEFAVVSVPEPGTLALFFLGVCALFAFRQRMADEGSALVVIRLNVSSKRR
ncbi:PEP-CTERM sorting domain-containing protein [Pelagibius sp. Alg239-R121]|uniref:PEP-CTERM sorting domain-containing protein n=1 Tax=Pelagibius sp. Alg239-R121 TaxID=2993448 RepID=UPI0024A6286B|nr:PEP-CTERM sorting domain-containing protein [Pelagibius sp. Alg239-R121]